MAKAQRKVTIQPLSQDSLEQSPQTSVWSERLPRDEKNNTISSGSAQDCPDSTSDLPSSSTKSQINVNDSQKPDTPSDFAPDRKTYEGYKLIRKPHLLTNTTTCSAATLSQYDAL